MAIPIDNPPAALALDSLHDNLEWFRANVCSIMIHDPRGHRVRFLDTDFLHLNKIVDKYGREHKNAKLALEEIERQRIVFKAGRFDPRRATELPWAVAIARTPWCILENWQPLGRGYPGEAYIANFGTEQDTIFRV